jgi:hypothetical protein
MNIDPQDFERHYAILSDDALLEINRDDLVEIAQDRLDRELARRGLSRSKAAAEAQGDGAWGKDDPGVVVSNFTYPDEAAEARDALEAAGIPCNLTQEEADSDDTADTTDADQPKRSSYRRSLGTLLLMVPSWYADHALALLAEEFGAADEIPEDHDPEPPDETQ